MNKPIIKRYLINIYEIFYEKKRILRLRFFYHLRIMSPDKTLKYILKNNCSISRFGDGEFDLIFQNRDLGFQNKSDEISDALSKVLSIKNKKLLICIPRCYNTTVGCNEHAKNFWIEWGKNGRHEEIINLIRNQSGKNYLFGDSQITRPYIDWKTNRRAVRTFPKLKKIWENKDIIIIEGNQTRMGVGNDLFDQARSIKRVLVPAINAFDFYNEIKNYVKSIYSNELLILAIGPTATVLAADFSKSSIQTIDLGNIDIEYEWFLRNATDRIIIDGKFTNEAKDGLGRNPSDCFDEKYLSQIVKRIGC